MLSIDSSVSLTSMLNRCSVRENEKYGDATKNLGVPFFYSNIGRILRNLPFFWGQKDSEHSYERQYYGCTVIVMHLVREGLKNNWQVD